MNARPDDDALSWAGDEPKDTQPATRSVLVEAPSAPRSMPAILVVTYGVIAGIYLIYTIGWVITVSRSLITLPTLFGEIMFQFGEFLAIASPAIWFAVVVVLTRNRPIALRLSALLLGLLVVIPWPFLLGV